MNRGSWVALAAAIVALALTVTRHAAEAPVPAVGAVAPRELARPPHDRRSVTPADPADPAPRARPVRAPVESGVEPSVEPAVSSAGGESPVGEAIGEADAGTWIVQLRVGHDAAEVLGAHVKPHLPFRAARPGAPAAFRLRAVDARGRTFEAPIDAHGLRPAGVPTDWCREDGAWVRGDQVLLPTISVLVKLPAALTRPIALEVTRSDGAVIGRGAL